MVNPFEDRDANFRALMNGDGDLSLWPQFIGVPEGWRIVAGPAPYAEIVAVIEAGGEIPRQDAA